MEISTIKRAFTIAGWSALGAVAAVLTEGTPIGIAIVAALAAVLAWRGSDPDRSGKRRRARS